MTREMGKVFKTGILEISKATHMMDTGKMMFSKDMVFTNGKMARLIMETGTIITNMELVRINIKMVMSIVDNGVMVCTTARVNTNGRRVAESTMASGEMERSKDMEKRLSRLEKYMRETLMTR